MNAGVHRDTRRSLTFASTATSAAMTVSLRRTHRYGEPRAEYYEVVCSGATRSFTVMSSQVSGSSVKNTSRGSSAPPERTL